MKINSIKLKKIVCILLDITEENIIDIYCIDNEKYIIVFECKVNASTIFKTIALQMKECKFSHLITSFLL